MKILFFFLVLFFSSKLISNTYSDFEIEGISLGDSLLEYMSKEEIIKEIKSNADMYKNLSKKFSEVFLFDNFENYKYLSFLIKPDDKDYIIHSIRGLVNFDNQLDKCLLKIENISEQISPIFTDSKKFEGSYDISEDPSGNSKVHYIGYTLLTGEEIMLQCYSYDNDFKNKNKYRSDNLSVSIETQEAYKWFITPIN